MSVNLDLGNVVNAFSPPQKSSEKVGTVIVVSPSDHNGALSSIHKVLERTAKTKQREVVSVYCKTFTALEAELSEVVQKIFKINAMIFVAHATSLRMQVTDETIGVPPALESNMWSEGEQDEAQLFNQFVTMIKNYLLPGGVVFLLGCTTAVDVDHPEKNIAQALASRLPTQVVVGTTCETTASMQSMSNSRVLKGTNLKVMPILSRL